jgi:hypothetical protein
MKSKYSSELGSENGDKVINGKCKRVMTPQIRDSTSISDEGATVGPLSMRAF